MSRKIKVLFSFLTIFFSLTAYSKKIIQDPVRPQQEPVRVVVLEKDFGSIDKKYNLEIHQRLGLIEQLSDDNYVFTIPASEPHLSRGEFKRLINAVDELESKGKALKLD